MASSAGLRNNPPVVTDHPITNVLGLTFRSTQKFVCMLTDNNFAELRNNASRRMDGAIETVLDQRFYKEHFDFARVWASICAATTATNAVPQGVTYVIGASVGRKQLNYVGKTGRSMYARYGAYPTTGGMHKIFGNAAGFDWIDATLYQSHYPALVEGWCFAAALTRGTPLLNIRDPG